jgi:hypothetical protein
VLYPGGRLPLRIFEQRYLEMAKACLKHDAPFGVCLILEGAEVLDKAARPAKPCLVGTLAKITDWDMPQLGLLQIVARGERRFRILRQRAQADGLLRASVELLPQDAESPAWRAADSLPLPLELKQALLELSDERERLERLKAFLAELSASGEG